MPQLLFPGPQLSTPSSLPAKDAAVPQQKRLGVALAQWLLLPTAGALAMAVVMLSLPAARSATPAPAAVQPAPTSQPSPSGNQPTAGHVGELQKIPWDIDDPEPIYIEGGPTALRAFVRAPAQLKPGGQPLALLIHGTHGRFRLGDQPDRCPEPGGVRPRGASEVISATGLVWLAEDLSRRGMVAVVIDASSMGCVFGQSGAYRRMELMLGLVRRWGAWQQGEAAPIDPAIIQAADLSRIVLVGHSSGGDAAALLTLKLAQPPPGPGTATVHVAALALIAPPDALGIPQIPVPTAIWLAQCDGDVGVDPGQRMHRRLANGRGSAPLVLWSVPGAVHNAANEAWRDEAVDGGRPVCRAEVKLPLAVQRELLGSAIGEWLAATVYQREAPAWVLGRAPGPLLAGGASANWSVTAMP